MPNDLSKIIQAARRGGEVLRKYFGQNLKTTQKTIASDFRTKADLQSERVILGALKKSFPKANFHAEENGVQDNGSDETFYIDPLDGTNNFVLGVPYFSVSIGLFRKGKMSLGVVYNPVLDRVYSAERGRGAFLNGRRIHVNHEKDIAQSTIGYSTGYGLGKKYEENHRQKLRNINVKRVLSNWSVALDFCLLASGVTESFFNYGTEIYDFAAGKLIALEAGAYITDLDGKKEKDELNSYFLSSNNEKIHQTVLKAIQ